MSRYVIILIGGAALACSLQVAAQAEVIVDHQPHPFGGPFSDTLFADPFGHPYSQQLADDFVISDADQATNLKWYGFYDADNPPAQETMRVRFYDARPSDGLPGLVLYEETFQNLSRVNTGRRVQTGIGPYEYLYQASFASPVPLSANTTYWLEVVQIGDVTTGFRWETSVSGNFSHAYLNPGVVDWRLTVTQGDLAFQLISPEPTSLAMLALGLISSSGRRRSGRRAVK